MDAKASYLEAAGAGKQAIVRLVHGSKADWTKMLVFVLSVHFARLVQHSRSGVSHDSLAPRPICPIIPVPYHNSNPALFSALDKRNGKINAVSITAPRPHNRRFSASLRESFLQNDAVVEEVGRAFCRKAPICPLWCREFGIFPLFSCISAGKRMASQSRRSCGGGRAHCSSVVRPSVFGTPWQMWLHRAE